MLCIRERVFTNVSPTKLKLKRTQLSSCRKVFFGKCTIKSVPATHKVYVLECVYERLMMYKNQKKQSKSTLNWFFPHSKTHLFFSDYDDVGWSW